MSNVVESVVEIKRKKLLRSPMVYDGDPSDYDFKRATFILGLLKGIKPFMDRHGRSFDNLLVTQGRKKEFLFISKGDPDVALYYSYDSYGFDEHLYLGWTKVKSRDFPKLSPEQQDELFSKGKTLDVWSLWKGERSLDLISHALGKLSADEANAIISGKLGDSLVKHASNIYITHDSLDELGRFSKSMKNLGTVQSKDLNKRMLASFKKGAIKGMLVSMKEYGGDPSDVPKDISLLRSKGANWPELDMIERSIKATKAARRSNRLNESSEWHDEIRDDLLRDADRELNHNLPEGNYWTIGKVIRELISAGLAKDAIVNLLSRHRKEIEDMQDWLLSQEMAGVQAGLSNMVQLVNVGVDWPNLRESIEKNKDGIMYTTLWELANSNEEMYTNDGLPILYGDLVKIGVSWPEMSVIERSVSANRSRMETEITEQRYQMGTWTENEIRKIVARYILGSQGTMALRALARDLHQIMQTVPGRRISASDMEKLTREAKPVIYADLASKLKRMASVPLNDMVELKKIGFFDDKIFAMLNDSRPLIVRWLLLTAKDENIHRAYHFGVEPLRSLGIEWPELDVIEKSYSSEFKSKRSTYGL